ncbi:MAG TPA: hypothetical protein PLP17_15840 [Oligoflexia bacterium]|nr:hypothetical protein [Oligoflexia bacterium]
METIGDMRGSDPKTKFSEMPAPGGAAYQVPQTSDADRDSATSAMHAGGYGAEFSSPWNAFGLIQSAPIADNAAKAFLAAHPQVTAQGKTALDIINRERDFALQLAAWRSMLSQKAALIQYEMAICGGLPLPYTNTGNHKGEPSSADFELSVAKFSAGIERRQSTWETVDQVNGAVLGFVKALYPEDGIKTIDDIAKLSEDKRVKAFKLFRQTVAGGGIFADAVTNHDKYTRATQDMVDRARQEDMSSLPSNRSQSRFFSHSVFPQ